MNRARPTSEPAHEGWECLPDHYDDGGFTGGNMERPALRRLMADIRSRQGRLRGGLQGRSPQPQPARLRRMMETFDNHHVAFVSVTQQFNTSTSMGRLMLNVLLSFAQFEREIISERTRDKIAAARRRGKWSGGMPILGYDVDPRGSKLVVNEDEAVRVRTIFELYLEHQSLIATIQQLDQRGWVNKLWTTRKGNDRGGKPFSKASLHKLLTNVTYIGRLRYKDEVHEGEHEAIVDAEIWQRVQSLLQRNGRTGGAAVRNKFGALLKGILRCVPCDCAMSPTHSTKNGTKRYRYYVCSRAQKRGWHTCPSKSIPAGEIERLVVEQIKRIGTDPTLLHETIAEARRQGQSQLTQLKAERRGLECDLGRRHKEIRQLIDELVPADGNPPATARLAELQERIRTAEQRTTEIREQAIVLGREIVDEREVANAMAVFDPVWETLTPREQVRVVQLLVSRVDYNGATGKVAITFRPSGIKTLADQLSDTEDAA